MSANMELKMRKLTKGGVTLELPTPMFKDYQKAVLFISNFFRDHSEIHKIEGDITRGKDNTVNVSFDLAKRNIEVMFMRDRLIERWVSLQRNASPSISTEVIRMLGAFYVVEWYRMAWLYSGLRNSLLASGVHFEHVDDGRISQTIKFENEPTADLVVDLYGQKLMDVVA